MSVACTSPLREHRIPMTNGYEQDALHRTKCYHFWQAGERKKIKNGYRKRVRRTWREELGKNDNRTS